MFFEYSDCSTLRWGFARSHTDGISHGLTREAGKAILLNPLLRMDHVLVSHWTRLAAGTRLADVMDQHRYALHLIESKNTPYGRVFAKGNQGVCYNG